jgi:hypothetical protein
LPSLPDPVRLFLDEGLPFAVAESLHRVGHPVSSAEAEGVRGWKDPDLIPWLAERNFVWVTKDDAARKAHIAAIRRHNLSVVWVRGLDGRKNRIDVKTLHLMLTVKVEQILAETSKDLARNWSLYMNGAAPALKRISDDHIDAGKPLLRTRKRRRR